MTFPEFLKSCHASLIIPSDGSRGGYVDLPDDLVTSIYVAIMDLPSIPMAASWHVEIGYDFGDGCDPRVETALMKAVNAAYVSKWAADQTIEDSQPNEGFRYDLYLTDRDVRCDLFHETELGWKFIRRWDVMFSKRIPWTKNRASSEVIAA